MEQLMLSASIWSEIAALFTSNCLALTGHVFDRVALADPQFQGTLLIYIKADLI